MRGAGEDASGVDAGDLVTHHIDDRFISTAAGDPRYAQYGDLSAIGPELWVMLMEKAEEDAPVDVAEGEELEFAGARWRVVSITEDPAHCRGGVIRERIQA